MRWNALGTLLIVFSLALSGCSSEDTAPTPDDKGPADHGAAQSNGDSPDNGASSNGSQDAKPPEVDPPPEAPVPAPPKIVDVVLSSRDAETCLVRQGHQFPLDVQLPNLSGEPKKLFDLQGEKLTAVLFFAGDNPYSVKWLEELAGGFQGQYPGLKLVAVDIKDTAEEAQALAQERDVKFPVLLDRQGDLFRKVATEGVPRLFLLDSQGKILWFCIDYSNLTYKEFKDAVLAASAEQ